MDFERIAADVAAILARKDGIKRCPDRLGWCWDSFQNRVKMIRGSEPSPVLLIREPYQEGPSGRYLAAAVEPSAHLTGDASPEQIASVIEELLTTSTGA